MDGGLTPEEKKALWLRAVPLVKKTIGRFVAAGTLQPYQATEDLLQDLLVGVSKSINSFDPAKGAFSTWVVARAQGEILNHLRALRRANTVSFDCDRLIDDNAVDLGVRLERDQTKQIVREAMKNLPPHYVLMLARAFGIGQQQMLLREIAAAEGKTVSVIQKDIMRALKQLQRFLPSV